MRIYKGYDRENIRDRKVLFVLINDLCFQEKLSLLRMDGHFIEFMENPNCKLQVEAVKDLAYEGEIIHFIDSPCHEAIIQSLDMKCKNIKGFYNPKEIYQIFVVDKWSGNIQYIKNPTENVQLKAIRDNPWNYKYIINPTKKVIEEYLKLTELKAI